MPISENPAHISFDTLQELHDTFENEQVEVKSRMICLGDICKKVTSFMNGEPGKSGVIFFGIKEEKGTGRINTRELSPVSFPCLIGAGDMRNTKLLSLEEFKKQLADYLKRNISPMDSSTLSDLIHVGFLPITSEQQTEEEGIVPDTGILFIHVKTHTELVLNVHDQKYYARLPIKDKEDFESGVLSGKELLKRHRQRWFNNGSRPIYYDTQSAVPELTMLFDYIYSRQYDNARTLLFSMPTLTQMTDRGRSNTGGNNALMIAALYSSVEFFKFLHEEYEMSFYRANDAGKTPLLMAAYIGNIDIVKYLLEKEPSLMFQKDRLGWDVFEIATAYNHVPLVRYFLETHKDHLIGKTDLLEKAAHTGAHNVMELLLESNDWSKNQLEKALLCAHRNKTEDKKESFDAVESLLQERLDKFSSLRSMSMFK